MKSYLEYIAVRLSEYDPLCEIRRPGKKNLRSCMLYRDAHGSFDEEVLYIMEPDEIMAAKSLPVNLVYSADKPLSIDGYSNWLCLRKPAPYDLIMESAAYVQVYYERYYQLLEALVSVMADKDIIQKIADLCYDFWGSPVSLFDASFKLLAYSSQYEPSDDRAQEIVQSGFMSVDAVKTLKKQDRLKVYLSRELYRITRTAEIAPEHRLKDQDFGYIDVPVRAQGKVIACLALIATSRSVDELDADCLLEISQFISLALQRDGAYMQSVANPFETLFRDILKGTLRDESVIETRLNSLGKQLKSQKRIAVVPLGGTSTEEKRRNSDAMQSELRGLLPGAITAYYKENIVLLLSDNEAVVIEQENTRFSSYVKINGLAVGISRQFTSLSQIQEHYQQAMNALRLGRQHYPDDYFYTYDMYVLMHELEIISQSADLKSFCVPALLRLAESSKRGDKELLTTLYYYIMYAKEQTKICDLLHIHRSTLFYRINKIQELLGMDLSDSFSSYLLTNSFHILRYTKILVP